MAMGRIKKDIPIPLDVFSIKRGPGMLDATLRQSRLRPNLAAHPIQSFSFAWLQLRAREKPLEFFLERRGQSLLDHANKAAYKSLERIFSLRSEHENPETFFERHMSKANDVVTDLVAKVAPKEANLFGLLDETAIIRTPAEVLMLLTSPYTSDRLRFELTRQVGLALTSAQLEAEKRSQRAKLKEVRSWLDVDLFDHGRKIGEGSLREVVSINDPVTNEVLYLEGAPDSPGNSTVQGVTRREQMRMRYVEGVGNLVTNPRIKRTTETIKKALIMAMERKNGKSDIVASSVTDRWGMLFTVSDQFYTKSESVDTLIAKIKGVLMNRMNLPESAFVEDQKNNGYQHQETRKAPWRRIVVNFPGMSEPLELMFTAMGDQLNRDNMIGKVDEATGIPHSDTHIAHSLYATSRDLRAFKLLFPSGDPTIYGTIDYDSITKQAYAKTIQKVAFQGQPLGRRTAFTETVMKEVN